MGQHAQADLTILAVIMSRPQCRSEVAFEHADDRLGLPSPYKTTNSRRNSLEVPQFYSAPPPAALLLCPSHHVVASRQHAVLWFLSAHG
jgi:hypothetical protein